MALEAVKNCVLCQSENTRQIFLSHNQHGRHVIDSADTFPVYLCNECTSVFLGHLLIDPDYYKKYYEQGYYKSTIGSMLSRILRVVSWFSIHKKEKLMMAHGPKKQGKISVLDIGCGTGAFLSQLNAELFIKSGVEINPEGVAVGRKEGLEIYDQNVLEADFTGRKFDVVTLWHVLEHVPNPVEVLKKIRVILEDDGVLIFEVPNTGGFGFQYGKEDWFHLDSPRHVILYNKKSAAKLCALAGFTVTRIESSWLDYPLDLFWSIRKSPIRYLFYPLYPFVKMFNRETLMFVCKKT